MASGRGLNVLTNNNSAPMAGNGFVTLFVVYSLSEHSCDKNWKVQGKEN